MTNPVYIIIGVVSMAVLTMLGINLYYMLKSRRNVQNDASHYMVMHQRLDSISAAIKDQLEHNRKFVRLISELLDKYKK